MFTRGIMAGGTGGHMGKRTVTDHFSKDHGPKRILALDGGGLRGILTLGYLSRLEALLRARHDDPALLLADYFDLIAGTSTGAIIGAGLARGMTVGEVTNLYFDLGNKVFRRSLWRRGRLRARYNEGHLVNELKAVFGEHTTLDDPTLKTGFLAMLKRLDTGSPWPLSTNPNARYWNVGNSSTTIPNREYPLWQVVRASTAAPSYFKGESIEIAKRPGQSTARGIFVDGGVSPHNNPALQALLYVTLNGYGLQWQTGRDQILLVSLGTGSWSPEQVLKWTAAGNAVVSLLSLRDDCSALVETILQWVSESPTRREIDREVGDLARDGLPGGPLCSYLRYDVSLDAKTLDPFLGRSLDEDTVSALRKMDDPRNMRLLHEIGTKAAEVQMDDAHFPATFNL
jgi:uncharacterized protein